MGLVLQLVETGADSRGRGIDVLELDQPRDLGDVANLGLTLPEAKQLLARVQQAVVAVRARDHAAALAHLERQGQERPASHRPDPQVHARLQG